MPLLYTLETGVFWRPLQPPSCMPCCCVAGSLPALGRGRGAPRPPAHTHMSRPPLRERCSCPIKFLWVGKWKQMQECCDVLQTQRWGCSPQWLSAGQEGAFREPMATGSLVLEAPGALACPSHILPLGQGPPWRRAFVGLVQAGLG